MSIKRILDGLQQALAVAKGEMPPARLTTYSECPDCGNVTRVDDGCCVECGFKFIALTAGNGGPADPEADR